MLPENDDVKAVEKLAEGINKNIEDLKKSVNEKANMADLEKRFETITKSLDSLVDKEGKPILPEQLVKQQEQLDEISTKLTQLGEYQKNRGESINDQVLKNLKSDDFKQKVKSPVNVRTGSLDFEVEIKAANIDTADIGGGTIETQVEPGVSAAPWRNTPIWDNVNKGVIGQGRDSISWWEETTRGDNASMVAEEAAPGSGSYKTWTKQSMNIMRIADFTKVSREALEDFEYINSEVNDLISNGIPRLREVQLLEGVGSTVYLKGVTVYAKTFACPANFNKVPAPNEGDVLAAAILQCNNGYTSDTNKKGYMPNLILLNPGDSINMRLLKNTLYSYLQHPLLSPDGSLFKGIRIAESLDLDAGQFVVGDFARAKAYIKRNMQIAFHYENEDDAKTDLVLVMATMRLAGLKISAADAYGFVTGTFAAGKPLIEEIVG